MHPPHPPLNPPLIPLITNLQPTPTYQRWSRGHKARGQGQGYKKISRPRTKDTGASVLQKKEGFQKFFSSNLKKKVFKNFFQAKMVFNNFFSGDFHLRKTKKGLRKFSARFLALSNKISTVQKIVPPSSRGQGSFRGLEASRPRTLKSVLEAKDVLEDSTSATCCTLFSTVTTPDL